MISTFSFPNQMVFGPGALNQLPDLLKTCNATRVLLVTDPGLVKIGLAERTLNLLQGPATCFDQVTPNPNEACLEAAVDVMRSTSCDFVVGLGGGSAMDTAKAVCLRLNHDQSLTEYEIQNNGAQKVTAHVPGCIAIPTTSGTGSEVGRSAVITLKDGNRKAILNTPKILPRVALCDPELTLGLPPQITAATGMDALTHNIEAYLSTTYHPPCDAVALGGVRLAAQNLETAVKDGQNIDARANMMMAASMGAIAFQKDLGVAHALAHPLSTLANVPHGLANAIMLSHTMKFNREAAPDRLKDIALALGCSTAGLSVNASATLAADTVHNLLVRLNLPIRLSEAGVPKDLIPELAAQAIADANHTTNPRPCTEADLVALYEAAF
ncbi:MAG: iron-containing alcohol dehydrogenase [bacterium]|nr:iron-containing alcohol dehydrogenase [bacterium]